MPAPLTGEPLALDLVNTRPLTPDGPIDLLADVAGLRQWLALEAERLPGMRAGAAELAAAREVREHAAAALAAARHGRRPPATALRGLNGALRTAPAHGELEWNGGTVTVTARRTGPRADRLRALLAEAVADLLTDPAVTTVRECAAGDCAMLFLPAHPRRRWCSAARCGNRARVARYYRRHR
ncbi:putative RNA-binding Zn ribbon-like protein [Prauserella shujinwangii]|uniref:Putative RNA-binding Zn ribbon-like protein n=1 Tax=Prauserella shujinwangii TaxID=1453103 RepID=A0A2T0LZ05_9PSEU|nr:CGNR zinc finger domain-containing protein [Prauserella shujinwangii]PRX49351.1 putative RNA-binding Zn ribbon-like protein [Prauserella shujinwangii]